MPEMTVWGREVDQTFLSGAREVGAGQLFAIEHAAGFVTTEESCKLRVMA